MSTRIGSRRAAAFRRLNGKPATSNVVAFPGRHPEEPGFDALVETADALIACLRKCRSSDDVQLSAMMWVLASGVAYYAKSEADVHTMMKEVHTRCLDAALMQYRGRAGGVR
ncbi:MAG: hypothetical protein ACOY4R_16295 [Pseudomonadota bacterium]